MEWGFTDDMYSESPWSGSESGGIKRASTKSEVRGMEALVVGAALVGSCATAFVVQRAVLSAMLRALGRGKPMQSGSSSH